MKLFNTIITLVLIIAFAAINGCNKLEGDKTIPIDDPINTPPQTKAIEVINISFNSATVFNSVEADPENDNIYYSLYLFDSLVQSEVSYSILYKFENLLPETKYSGKLVITDSIHEDVVLNYQFTTTKYKNYFDNMYYNPEGNTRSGSSIQLTKDGGYIVLANINKSSPYPYIVKIDSLGYEQWSKLYQLEGEQTNVFMGQIIETVSGNYLAVFESTILKIDKDGNIIWKRNDINNTYNTIIETVDKDYIIAGRESNFGLICKFSSIGELIWEQKLSQNDDVWFSSICQSDNNNYMLLGSSHHNLWITSINDDGEINYNKNLEMLHSVFSETITKMADNDFYICGSNKEGVVAKIDVDANIIWSLIYKKPGFYNTYIKATAWSDHNCIVICGYNENYSEEAFLMKVNQFGEIIGETVFKPEYSDYTWRFNDMKLTTDGNYIMVGIKTWLWNGFNKEDGLWIKKTTINNDDTLIQ